MQSYLHEVLYNELTLNRFLPGFEPFGTRIVVEYHKDHQVSYLLIFCLSKPGNKIIIKYYQTRRLGNDM